MIRRSIVGVGVAILGMLIASPVQAAEWCLNDPALRFTAPADPNLTVYATEGVLGLQHQPTLARAKIHLKTKPGKRARTEEVTIIASIPNDSTTFPTELIVSSGPTTSGTIYGTVTGTSGKDMVVSFVLHY